MDSVGKFLILYLLLKELFKEPKQFLKQTIEYQNKSFEVLPETLLTLIVYFFKLKADKKCFFSDNSRKDHPTHTHSLSDSARGFYRIGYLAPPLH